MKRASASLKVLLKLTFSVGVIAYLFSQVDLDETMAYLRDVDGRFLVAVLAVVLFGPFAQAMRWMIIVRTMGEAFTYVTSVSNIFIGLLFNQFLPSSIGGDAVRMWRVYKLGFALDNAINSVLLDRISALFALVLMVATSIPLMYASYDARPEFLAAPLFVGAAIAAFVVMFFIDRIPESWQRWRPMLILSRLSTASRTVLLRPSTGLSTVLLSFLTHGTSILTAYFLARALQLDVGLLDCFLLIPPVILFSVLPISVAGWGVREGALVTALSIINIDYDAAFTLSVMFGLSLMSAALPGAAFWLLSRDAVPGQDISKGALDAAPADTAKRAAGNTSGNAG